MGDGLRGAGGLETDHPNNWGGFETRPYFSHQMELGITIRA